MGRRGPIRKPADLVMGHHRRNDTSVNPQPERELLPAPRGLDAIARERWEQVAPALYELGVLTILDGPMLAMYCTFFSFWRQASDAIKKHGLTYTTKRGLVRPRPELKIMRDCAALLRALAGDFGMTPAARARLHVQGSKPKEEADPWAEFASKPE